MFFEDGGKVPKIDVAGDEGLADPPHQHEGERTRANFLVLAHAFDELIRRPASVGDAIKADRQADGLEVAANTVPVFRRAQPHPNRQIEGHDHADGDGLAVMERVRIAAVGFERMAEGVAQVQKRALALFTFIRCDDRRLGLAAFNDDVTAGLGVAIDNRFPAMRRIRRH